MKLDPIYNNYDNKLISYNVIYYNDWIIKASLFQSKYILLVVYKNLKLPIYIKQFISKESAEHWIGDIVNSRN